MTKNLLLLSKSNPEEYRGLKIRNKKTWTPAWKKRQEKFPKAIRIKLSEPMQNWSQDVKFLNVILCVFLAVYNMVIVY